MPSRTPICSARSWLVLRGLPTMPSRMFIGGWFALRLSSCVTICSELARKVNGGEMRDAARFCCNPQKRLYVYVNSPTETDGHDTWCPYGKMLSRFPPVANRCLTTLELTCAVLIGVRGVSLCSEVEHVLRGGWCQTTG